MCLLFVFKIPWWLRGKESTCNAGDGGSAPGLGRSSGEGNGNPLQCSCLGNRMDRGAWRGHKESDKTEHSLTHHTLRAIRLLQETSAICGPIPLGFL